MMRVLAAASLFAALALGQAPDTILVNGKIATVDARDSIQEALAIRDGRIAAVGTNAAIRRLAVSKTRVIDLGGHTVIPGLIDSHLHAIRAALSFSTEVNWVGTKTMAEAMARIHEASVAMKPGSWLIVAGGWNVNQFKERRRPTQAELLAAAPNNPAYVQQDYAWVVMTPAGFKAMGITLGDKDDATLPQGAKLDRDAQGKPTGGITGGTIALFDKLPKPSYEDQLEGTKKFFRELNRLGITGVVDPGGNNLFPNDYRAVQEVWRKGEMTVRVAYALCGQTPGTEFDDFKSLTQMTPMGFGDDMLRFNGLGERITAAMNNNNNPSAEDSERYYQIVKWAADRGMSVTMHWDPDSSVSKLLDIWERVNRETPIKDLRWSIAHLNDASEVTLRRMKALGVGWTVQDAMYFGGDAAVARDPERAKRIPPVNTAKRVGVVAGAGTDAHRVASYNPFTSLQWFLDGKTVSGVAIRGPEETPSRADALRMYTLGSAWFSKDELKRGSLEVGKLADLAVLSKDYLTVPTDQISGIESLLTMVGGRVVYAAAAFSRLAPQRP